MSNVKIGTAAATEQPPEYEFDPNTGWRTIRRFKGPDANIQAKKNELTLQGYSFRYRPGYGGNSELEARIATEISGGGVPVVENPTAVWTLSANVVEKDILESNIAEINTLRASYPEELTAIRNWLDKGDESVYPALTQTGAITLFDLIRRGVKSRRVLQPTIKAELLVSSTYQTKQNMFRVGAIISSAKMRTLEGVPNDILFNVADTGETVQDTSLFIEGWFKYHPTVTDAPQGKFRISLEYEYGHWSKFLYDITNAT